MADCHACLGLLACEKISASCAIIHVMFVHHSGNRSVLEKSTFLCTSEENPSRECETYPTGAAGHHNTALCSGYKS